MRQQWFKELLVVNSACQTVWLSGDLKLQLTAVDCVPKRPKEKKLCISACEAFTGNKGELFMLFASQRSDFLHAFFLARS